MKVDGKLHGKGKMTYVYKSVYDGEWKDGKKHGIGKMIYPDKSLYEGEWKDVCAMGRGNLQLQTALPMKESGKMGN
jgi:hypothetical protein